MAPATATSIPLLMLPLKDLKPSPLNPRQHFDQAKLEELAATMGDDVGIIEPLVARSVNGHYELVAGERRWRAAKIAKLDEVPVVVRPLTDAQALEIMVIENGEREGLNALEEGEGFKQLLKFGFDVDRLAGRIKKSRKYVYDRMKLVADLIGPAKKLLLDERLTPAHAILLARLTPADQGRALDPHKGGMFTQQDDDSLFRPGEMADVAEERKKDPYTGLKLVSVREFEAWVVDSIRVDPSDQQTLAALYPDTAPVVEEAERVISITNEHYLHDEKLKKGVLTSAEWRRADGLEKTKTCAISVLGVVVIGRGRGDALKVCVDRTCKVHWKAEAAGRGAQGQTREVSAWEKKHREQQRTLQAKRARFKKAMPAIKAACAERLPKVSLPVLIDLIARRMPNDALKEARALLPKASTPEDVLRVFALSALLYTVSDSYNAEQEFPKIAKAIGLNVKPLLTPKREKKAAVTTTAQTSRRAKKTAKKR